MSTSEISARHKWEEIVQRQRASGLSVAAFCRREEIAAASFYYWKRRLTNAGAPVFVEAKVVETPPPSNVITIRLRGGRRLMVRPGVDRELLAEVVAVLEGLS